MITVKYYQDQCIIPYMCRKVQAILNKDRKLRAATAWMVVEALFMSDPPLVKEACIWIQGWYRDVKDHPPPPARVTIE